MHKRSTLGDSQGGRLKFVVHLLLREFFGREFIHPFNRDGIVFQSQFKRPGGVFVFRVFHFAGYGTVADIHVADITRIRQTSTFLGPSQVGVILAMAARVTARLAGFAALLEAEERVRESGVCIEDCGASRHLATQERINTPFLWLASLWTN